MLDSSVLVSAERQHLPVSTLLERFQEQHSAAEIVLSAISVFELEHGVFRSQSPQQRSERRIYLDTVFSAIPAEPLGGITILFADLLISGTALYFGYGLVTSNVRHFQMITGLTVMPF